MDLRGQVTPRQTALLRAIQRKLDATIREPWFRSVNPQAYVDMQNASVVSLGGPAMAQVFLRTVDRLNSAGEFLSHLRTSLHPQADYSPRKNPAGTEDYVLLVPLEAGAGSAPQRDFLTQYFDDEARLAYLVGAFLLVAVSLFAYVFIVMKGGPMAALSVFDLGWAFRRSA